MYLFRPLKPIASDADSLVNNITLFVEYDDGEETPDKIPDYPNSYTDDPNKQSEETTMAFTDQMGITEPADSWETSEGWEVTQGLEDKTTTTTTTTTTTPTTTTTTTTTPTPTITTTTTPTPTKTTTTTTTTTPTTTTTTPTTTTTTPTTTTTTPTTTTTTPTTTTTTPTTTTTTPTTTTTTPTTTTYAEHSFNRKGAKGNRFGINVKVQDERLPGFTKPLDYDLKLKINLPGHGWVSDNAKNMTIEGEVSIRIQTSTKISEIVLNSLDLKFDESKCSVLVDNTEIPIESIEDVPVLQMIFVNLKKPVEANKEFTLKLTYTGPIRDDLTGIFLNTYQPINGRVTTAAVSQMKPIDARKVVPCYDEPAMKAPWIVTIIHPKGTTALSNQIEKDTVPEGDDFLRSTFEKTPTMSTYLLAFFVSDLVYNEAATDSAVRVRMWSRAEEKDATLFALGAATKILNTFEKSFGIPYAMKKIDVLAVPDFLGTAMENWGLIPCVERDLLFTPATSNPGDKRSIVRLLGREFAHQWFGNLVTMKWWNDLWLSEAFATYYGYIGTDEAVGAHFRMNGLFKYDAYIESMRLDSLPTSHPIRAKIEYIREIKGLFDEITSMKGAAVLNMIATLIGKDNFDKAIRNYLSKHSYGNAETMDLIAALQEQTPSVIGERTDFKIGDFVDQWTEQMGYPLLNIKKLSSTKTVIETKRFLTKSEERSSDKYSDNRHGYKWDIPIWLRNYRYHLKYSEDIFDGFSISFKWLTAGVESMNVYTHENVVLVANYESAGYYRVDNTGYFTIQQLVQRYPQEFTTESKLRFMDDWLSVDTYHHNPIYYFTSYVFKETANEPWLYSMNKINELFNLASPPVEKIPEVLMVVAGRWGTQSYDANFDKINYLDENALPAIETARMVVTMNCVFGISKIPGQPCNKRIQSKVFDSGFINKCKKQELSKCSTIPTHLRKVYYCEMMRLANSSIVEVIEEWYKMERNYAESNSLLNALTCTEDTKLITKYLTEFTKKTDVMIRPQEMPVFMESLTISIVSRGVLLDFVIAHFAEIENTVANSFILSRAMEFVFMPLSTPEELDKFSKWIDNTPNAKKYGFEKFKAIIRKRVEWNASKPTNTFYHLEMASQG